MATSQQRKAWFSSEMALRRTAYVHESNLTLFAGTWNVNGRLPEAGADIRPWLFPANHTLDADPLDVYMLGLQEVQPLAGVDAVRTDPSRGAAWKNCINQILSDHYELIADRQLVGIVVMVFVRRCHVPFVRDVQLSYAATGFMNALGNKGGVAARFALYDRAVSCVACHLAAHDFNVQRRNQDFRDVARKAVFLPTDASPSASFDEFPAMPIATPMPQGYSMSASFPAVAVGASSWLGSVATAAATALADVNNGASSVALNNPNAINILDHDAVFWLGDLNYRVEADPQQVLAWIKARNWPALVGADQLTQQMKVCDVFSEFREGPLRFAPTYKLDRFEEVYSTDENGDVKRTPSYTDRILWRVGNQKGGSAPMATTPPSVSLREYNSVRVFSSDHRPVYAAFSMAFGIENPTEKESAAHQVNRYLDVREAEMRPSVRLSSDEVDLGEVHFGKPVSKRLVILNDGKVPVIVSLISPNGGGRPAWLQDNSADLQNCKLSPGESATLRVRVLVTSGEGVADALVAKESRMDAALTVNVDPGGFRRETRIIGHYVPTTIGLSLETLSMHAEPIATVGLESSARRVRTPTAPRDVEVQQRMEPGIVPLSVPKELWWLVNALLRDDRRGEGSAPRRYMDRFPDLFLQKADMAGVERTLSCIDRGEIIPRAISGIAIASCLVHVISNLEKPVIPQSLYRKAIQAGRSREADAVLNVLSQLPALNWNTFWYVIRFIAETPPVLRENKAMEVSAVFGQALLRPEGGIDAKEERERTSFVYIALCSCSEKQQPPPVLYADLAMPLAKSQPSGRSNREAASH